MSDHSEAIRLLSESNTDGQHDSLIADIADGKVKAGVLDFKDSRALELARAYNVLGRYDAMIATCERLQREPVVYIYGG